MSMLIQISQSVHITKLFEEQIAEYIFGELNFSPGNMGLSPTSCDHTSHAPNKAPDIVIDCSQLFSSP